MSTCYGDIASKDLMHHQKFCIPKSLLSDYLLEPNFIFLGNNANSKRQRFYILIDEFKISVL